AATLAIFIIIHLSMFGFNANALMLTFTIYLMFKSKLTKNFLGPISIYLLIDIFFVHYNINLTGFFNFFSEYIFSINTVIILSILPLTYLFLIAERKFIEKWSNNFFSKYLLFIIIAAIFGLTFLTGTILSDSSLTYFSYFLLMFYFIGAFSHKNDIITSVYLLLPLGLIILIAYILKQSLNL
ncbi:hypothetical protein, partial [Halobacillus trueperi]|uniref:hypothetical protein n=1 Tax=Halobacillus trueperi TaxID=156205 RepID=UPI001C6F4382